jgi:N-acetylmuramoyl-L-alanine amidase
MILISAGHHPLAKGAGYNDHYEHDEAVIWASEIAGLIRGRMMVDIVPTGSLGDKIEWINNQTDAVLLCEIHFNSDESKRQTGSETLYCPGSVKGKAAAEIVQKALAGIFPPSRGAKEGYYQMDKTKGPDAILVKTNCVALIVEPEFIYNYAVIEERRSPACVALADALVKAAT